MNSKHPLMCTSSGMNWNALVVLYSWNENKMTKSVAGPSFRNFLVHSRECPICCLPQTRTRQITCALRCHNKRTFVVLWLKKALFLTGRKCSFQGLSQFLSMLSGLMMQRGCVDVELRIASFNPNGRSSCLESSLVRCNTPDWGHVWILQCLVPRLAYGRSYMDKHICILFWLPCQQLYMDADVQDSALTSCTRADSPFSPTLELHSITIVGFIISKIT